MYSPVTDRFVCVDHDHRIFEQLVFLLSSKIRLLIVPIHCAPNFEIDLIDNTCCTRWAVTNWPPESLNEKFLLPRYKINFFVNDCGELIEKPNKDLVEIQNFIFLAFEVIKIFRFSNNYQYRIFSNLVDLPFDGFKQIKEIEKECIRTIYLSSDYQSAKEKIDSLCSIAKTLL